MKILCDTQVVNRQTQLSKSRAAKATIAVGFRTKATTSANHQGLNSNNKELEIIHFTPQNKIGVRYKVKNNIEKMFTKFVQDGKATISFKNPPDNLMIKCDPIQLKGFLQMLKIGIDSGGGGGGSAGGSTNAAGVCNDIGSSSKIRLNIAGATAIPQKSHPVHRMTVLKRSGYPVKGFPKTLKSLIISGIDLCKISFDICTLRNLTLLNLSDNAIKCIPVELGRLPLIELNLTNNRLDEKTSWQWLTGPTLRTTLKELQLSQNQLKYFPNEILKLTNLITLKINHNLIRKIPFGIRRMKQLRHLYMSNNRLESLPSAFNETYLEMLDVWGNNFQPQCTTTIDHRILSSNNPAPLWLLAARCVSRAKVAYTAATLPAVLIDLLMESPKCSCGQLCYLAIIWERATLATLTNINEMIFSRDRLIYADIVICSSHCAARVEYEQLVSR